MTGFLHSLRSGGWLTFSRLRGYGVIMLAVWVIALAGWIALSDGVNDRNGKPLGTDFSSFYTAGQLAREGRAADAYVPVLHHGREKSQFGAETPYYSWLYPPVFFLIAAPLSALPYSLALAVWQLGSFALYLGALALIVRGFRQRGVAIGSIWILIATAFPAVAINLGHGQNGFLTAAIFGAALALLPTRPVVSGALFALLAYKPQFAILIPFALLAARQWQAIATGIAALAMLLLVTTLLFGHDSWTAFVASGDMSRRVLLEQGAVGYEKLQSTFAAVRLWGGSVPLAYTLQGTVSLLALAGVIWSWRKNYDAPTQAATLILATLIASPHVMDYDLVLLAPAIAILAGSGLQRGFRPCEISLLAATWIVPLVTRVAAATTLVPLGLLVTLLLFAIVMRRQHEILAQA